VSYITLLIFGFFNYYNYCNLNETTPIIEPIPIPVPCDCSRYIEPVPECKKEPVPECKKEPAPECKNECKKESSTECKSVEVKDIYQDMKAMSEDTKRMVKSTSTQDIAEGGLITFTLVKNGKNSFYFGHPSPGLPQVLGLGHFYWKVEWSVLLALEHHWKKHSANNEIIFLDVGSNSGWFSMQAASKGLKVHAFDVQPGCVRWVETEILLNGFHDLVKVYNKGVATKDMVIDMEMNSCNGGYTFDASKTANLNDKTKVLVKTMPLDPFIDTLGGKQIVVKMDTEGSEVDILKSMMGALRRKAIMSLVVEVVPNIWHMKGVKAEEGIKVFNEIIEIGYTILVLYDPNAYPTDCAVKTQTPEGVDQTLDVWRLVSVERFMRQRLENNQGTNIWIYREL
jgi:FkbM family methyltransferase